MALCGIMQDFFEYTQTCGLHSKHYEKAQRSLFIAFEPICCVGNPKKWTITFFLSALVSRRAILKGIFKFTQRNIFFM